MKRIILAILLLAVAGLIGYGLYLVFYKKQLPAFLRPAPTAPSTTTGQLPTAGQRPPVTGGGAVTPSGQLPQATAIPQTSQASYYEKTELVTRATTDMASFTSLNSSVNAIRYHNPTDGKFYQIAADGAVRPMSDQTFYDVQNVTWAKNQDKAIIAYPDGSKIVYNFDNKTQMTTLPKHWQDFSFSPDGTEIAAKSIGLSPENRWLVTTNDDGTGTKLIEPMGNNADKVLVDWSPSGQTVAFSDTGSALGLYRREIYFVGLNHENFKSTVVEGMGFVPQWSPTGQKLLYSVFSDRDNYKPELWIVNSYSDSIGSGRKQLSVSTWADKCVFSDDNTVFCAVPNDLPTGAGMSPAVAANSTYSLYKIDIKTGLKLDIPLGDQYTIKDITYDAANKKVIFTDYYRNGVFEVKL